MAGPSEILTKKFPFEPTEGQKGLFRLFDDFLLSGQQDSRSLIIRGYAGTGKTTMISAVVKMLPFFDFKYVLMAPTGRAAKVMSGYARRTAFTIHKKIFQQTAKPGGELKFERQKNYHKRTVFIVDEASMLADRADFGNKGLLSELMHYVFEQPGNRLLLVGDVAQLPPVGSYESPALVADYLRNNFDCKVTTAELTDVMRQEGASGILFNATELRRQLSKEKINLHFVTSGFNDIYRMTGERLEDGLRYAYDKYGVGNTVVVCRSNKNAVQYNQYIRRTIQYREAELEVGDFLMVVRNNYFFLPENAPAGFLANGDFVEVLKIISFEEVYGLRYATLELRLVDYPGQVPFEAKVIMDTLHAPGPALPDEAYQNLYGQVEAGYEDLSTKAERRQAIKKDAYLNALQVKFAYALTCHKSQGGQWDAVFVDQGYMREEMVDKDYLRWLYTAVTRAAKELFLVNFHPNFF